MEKIYALLDVSPGTATVVTAVSLAISFVIAEQLYKFHSFTLETGAFLVTWFALRRLGLLVARR
jgi:xanthosine utilization system XapX-like protein